MKQFPKAIAAVAIAVQVLLAQEIDPPAQMPDTISPPIPASEPMLKPAPIATLSGINLSKSCMEDFTNLFGEDGFDMAKFITELLPAVVKVKLQLKSPFGKPKDSDKTDAGLTVGCIKSLPESPAEITSLLKDISLKMGLNLVAVTAANLADNPIPANVATECSSGSSSGSSSFKTIMYVSLIASGLGTVIYGIGQDGEVAGYVDKRNGKAAVNAEKSRNMSYGIGAALLASGLIIYIVF
jgi:hypothetical protein